MRGAFAAALSLLLLSSVAGQVAPDFLIPEVPGPDREPPVDGEPTAEPSTFDMGFLIMAPKVLTAGTTETFCVRLLNMTGPVTLTISLLKDQGRRPRDDSEPPEVLAALQPYFMEFAFACLDLEVPEIEGEQTKAVFQVEGQGELDATQSFLQSKRVWIKGNNWESFIQTDKSIYKPGQTVKFRMLTIDQNFRPDLTEVYKIWVEAPSGIHMAQWLYVETEANDGIVDLELPMTSDPPLGEWKIKALHRGKDVTQTFTVDEYVLPKFEIDIQAPSYILINESRMDAKICAKYTYGQPVRGALKAVFSIANDGWSARPRPIIKYNIEDTGKDGCQDVVVEVYRLELNSTDFGLWNARVHVEADFTERATGITLSEAKDITKVATEALSLEFKAPQTFKPGVPFYGKLFVTYPDGSPAGDKTIHLTADTNEGRVFDEILTTPRNGIVDFGAKNISIQSSSLSLYAQARGYSNAPTNYDYRDRIRYIYDPSASFGAQPQFSPSGSFIQIAPILETVDIGSQQALTIDFTARDAEKESIEFSFLFMSKGNILRVAPDSLSQASDPEVERVARETPPVSSSDVPSEPSESDLDSSSQFSFVKSPNTPEPPIVIVTPGELNTLQAQVTVTPEMMPVTRVLVYYIRKDGEVVTDSMTFNVQQVFDNEVTMSFAQNEAAPGGTTKLKIQAAPGSLCGVGVVDKSVQLLGGDNQLKKSKVFLSLEKHQLSDRDGELDTSKHCPEPLPSWLFGGIDRRRRKRTVIYNPHQTYEDASLAFKQMGLIFLTNIQVETRPCKSNEWYYRGRGIPDVEGPLALPVLFDAQPVPVFENEEIVDDVAFLGQEEPDEPAPVTVRTYFPETWLWDLVRIGDESNEAEVEVEVPDTITDWVGSSFCSSVEQGIGVSSPVSLRAFQPFFASYNLPYSVIRGEEVPISVTVFNYLSECMVIELTLQDSIDFALKGAERSQRLCVCGSESKTAVFDVVFSGLGMIPIEVHAVAVDDTTSLCGNELVSSTSVGFSDGVRRELLVEPEGVEEEYTINSYFCPEETKGLFTSVKNLALPVNVVRDSQKAKITLTGDLMGPTLSNLDGLLRVPTGCGEQNMLGMVPNIFVMQYLESTQQITPATAEKAKANMKIGYQRELNYRRNDNSYSAFGMSDPEGSTWLTAFVVRSFAQAGLYIYIDREDLDRSITWLRERQNETTGCFESMGKLCHKAMSGGVNNELTLTAYVVITMVETGLPQNDPAIEGGLRCLHAGIPSLTDTYTTTQMAYALALAGSPELPTVMEKLEAAATQEDGTKYWKSNRPQSSESYGYYGVPAQDIEMTGYALMAYMEQLEGGDALIAGNPIARWIVAQRNSQGGFSSTQDTVIGLQALANYAHLAYTGGVSIQLKVRTHPQRVKNSFIVSNLNRLIMQEMTLDSKNVPTRVTFEGRGSGCALLQTAVSYNVIPKKPTTPAFTLSHEVREIEKGKRCSLYSMQVCTSYTGGDEVSNMALLRVKMQTGFIPVKSTLARDLLKQQTKAFRRVEVDGKMINFYFDELTSEETCIVFSIEKTIEVKDIKDGAVTIMDYYEQSLTLSEMVKLPCPKEPLYLDPTFADVEPLEPREPPVFLEPRVPFGPNPIDPLRQAIPLGVGGFNPVIPEIDIDGPDITAFNQCPEGRVFADGVKKCISPVGNACQDGTTCDRGYTCVDTDSGTQCVDLNECAKYNDICKGDLICTNIEGSYLCAELVCSEGYKISADGHCEDLNECDLPDACDSFSQCVNTDGGFNCEPMRVTCVEGYRLNPDLECEDIDECAENPNICGPGNQCGNVLGGHICAIVECVTGYIKNASGTCVDMDECEEDGVCEEGETCLNTPGGYSCRISMCTDGYRAVLSPEGDLECVDIDECAEVADLCGLGNLCTNSEGSYFCAIVDCSVGFIKDESGNCVAAEVPVGPPEILVIDPCTLLMETGKCRGRFSKYGYNFRTGVCEEFIYGGCDGNDNRFDTVEACEQACLEPPVDRGIDEPRPVDPLGPIISEPDRCTLPMETGKCRGRFLKYGYNSGTGACEEFIYGGCDGNSNRFDTVEACEQACLEPPKIIVDPVVLPDESVLPELCKLPLTTGLCEALFYRYGYNQESGECEEFTYGGCGGNVNRFSTVEECTEVCGSVSQGIRPVIPQKYPGQKMGQCLPYIDDNGPCVRECLGDNADCPGNLICCFNGCGYQCTPFTLEDPPEPKAGMCAPLLPGAGMNCNNDEIVNECYYDYNCEGDMKCCQDGCNSLCVPPLEVDPVLPPSQPKAGLCLIVDMKEMAGVCSDECFDDYACPDDQKCCSNGCGRRCMPAYNPSVHAYGECPPMMETGICLEECTVDSDCETDNICCYTGCGHVCSYAVIVEPLPDRLGQCPILPEFAIGPCANLCQYDYDCAEGQKCCSNGCGFECMAATDAGPVQPLIPERNEPKPGECPSPALGIIAICIDTCANDQSCLGSQKCCSNGCGLQCMEALIPPSKPGQCPVFDPALACLSLVKITECQADGDCEGLQKCCDVACNNRMCTMPVTTPPADPKPGQCPVVESGGFGICVQECNDDSGCMDDQKCCTNGCGHTCMDPITPPTDAKPGQCPVVESGGFGICVQECDDDSSCMDDQKCCANGCGRTCMDPITPPTDPKPGQCPVVESDGFGICVQECDDDSSCMDDQKCCANGCGRTCMDPISIQDETKPGWCPKMSLDTFGICVEMCSDDYSCPDGHKCCPNGCGRTCLPAYDPNVHIVPGECPPVFEVGTCEDACTVDADCGDEMLICCFNGCGRSCTPFIIIEPPMTKMGVCPEVQEGQAGVCANLCDNDFDCEENEMCCSNGCGYQCTLFVPMEPVGPMEPVEPVGPVEPVEPVDPVEPVGPVEPVEPQPQPQAPKPGVCPMVDLGTVGICLQECNSDSVCEGDKKCCTNGCGNTCMPAYDPAVNNFSECPLVTDVGICTEECLADSDCGSENKICCFNGCGHTCIPLTDGVPPEPGPISLDCPYCLTDLTNLPDDIIALICEADFLVVVKWRAKDNRVRFVRDLITEMDVSQPSRVLNIEESCSCSPIVNEERFIIVGQSDRIMTGKGKGRRVTLGTNAFVIRNDAKLKKTLIDIRSNCP